MAKATKREAKYTPNGTLMEHCGLCAHFIAPTSCGRIVNPVVRGGWCKFFTRKSVRK